MSLKLKRRKPLGSRFLFVYEEVSTSPRQTKHAELDGTNRVMFNTKTLRVSETVVFRLTSDK